MPDLWIDVDAALAEVPVNLFPLIDDTDFKSREVAIVYNQAGMDLVWNFVTPAGAMTQTAVTPTTAGVHDWAHVGDGMYTLEIPASAGTINNNLEGFGWFSGVCTGVLPWRGPVIGFRDALINDLLIENAYSATRGLAGTALPAAVADAVGGLAISDAGGLDLDAKLANTNEVTAARMATLTDWINGGRLDLLLDAIPTTAMRGTDSALLASSAPTNFSSMGIEADGHVHADVKEWLGASVTLSTGNKPDVNIDEISDDATAAATLELFAEILDQSTGQLDSGSLGASLDAYGADIVIIKGASNDEYSIIFHKNGEPVTSGITSPTIQVIKDSDGTDLIASVALTQIASTGTYKRTEGTNRIVDGSGYNVKVQATIGGATQTGEFGIGRDN